MDISDLKIEGHASSEGRLNQTPQQAYLYNLDLSQRRAQNALQVCLSSLTDPSVMNWARGRLSATGYSSARLIENEDGSENREASRRVEFSMAMNREKLLDEIRGDLASAESRVSLPKPALLANLGPDEELGTRGIPRVVDGDTLV
ncbi:OmpA family protein, partial [Rhodovulum sulfidophilum]|nr:OmpA family protein [Rhodovulum sulfidophilum]